MVKRPAGPDNMAMNVGSWLPLSLMMAAMNGMGMTLDQPVQKKKKTQLQESVPRETPAAHHDQGKPAECPLAPTHSANGDSIAGPAFSRRSETLAAEVEEMSLSVDELILNQRFYEACHRRLLDFFPWSTFPRLGNFSTMLVISFICIKVESNKLQGKCVCRTMDTLLDR